MSTYKPKQRIPVSEKNRQWVIDNANYYRNHYNSSMVYDSEILNLYMIAAGRINTSAYNYITDPYKQNINKTKGNKNKKNHSAKFKNWDIVSPIFKQILNEWQQRDFEPIAYCRDNSYDNEVKQYEKELIINSLQQRFVNYLTKSGKFDPNQTDEQGQPVQPPMSPEAIKKQLTNLVDEKTIQAQNLLDYVIDTQKIHKQYGKEFYDLLVTNRCVSFKTVINNKVVKNRVHPASFRWTASRNVDFFEDAEMVSADYELTMGELLDIFQDEFNKPEYIEEYGDIFSALEMMCSPQLRNTWQGKYRRLTDSDSIVLNNENYNEMYNRNGLISGTIQSENLRVDDKFVVTHIQWTSFKKVANVEYNGETVMVDESYIENQYDKLDWFWIEETREVYVIEDRFIIGGNELEFERRSKIDPYKSKKEYNGCIYMNDVIQQLPLPVIATTYQEAYNIIRFKLQTIINKNKDKIVVLPLGLITSGIKDTSGAMGSVEDEYGDDTSTSEWRDTNAKGGNDSPIARTLYYADVSSTLFVDDSVDGAVNALQNIKVLDMSLSQHIAWLYDYSMSIKSEWEELVGFNRFRKANINSSDTVANAQMGAYVGSLLTEGFFSDFEHYVSSDLQGIMDLSQYAYKDGFSTKFLHSVSNELVNLSFGSDFFHNDLGVVVKNTKKLKDGRDMMLQQATQLLQNNFKQSIAAKLFYKSKNFASIIQDIEAAEQEMIQQQQQQQEADRQNQLQIAQIEEKSKEQDRTLKKYEIDTRANVELEKQLNQLIAINMGMGNEDVALNLEKNRQAIIAEFNKQQLEREKIMFDREKNIRDNETKKYAADISYKVAKENKGQ